MRTRLNAGPTGCMGTGVPYAIGAKLARPDAPCVLFCGDYAFGAAFNDIETAKRVGANIVCVVLNNQGVAGHRMAHGSFDGDLTAGAMLPAKYEKIAEMVDGHAEAVTRPEEIRPALERALAADAPAVVTRPGRSRLGARRRGHVPRLTRHAAARLSPARECAKVRGHEGATERRMDPISADSHVMEAEDVFIGLPERFGDDAPRVVGAGTDDDAIVIPALGARGVRKRMAGRHADPQRRRHRTAA